MAVDADHGEVFGHAQSEVARRGQHAVGHLVRGREDRRRAASRAGASIRRAAPTAAEQRDGRAARAVDGEVALDEPGRGARRGHRRLEPRAPPGRDVVRRRPTGDLRPDALADVHDLAVPERQQVLRGRAAHGGVVDPQGGQLAAGHTEAHDRPVERLERRDLVVGERHRQHDQAVHAPAAQGGLEQPPALRRVIREVVQREVVPARGEPRRDAVEHRREEPPVHEGHDHADVLGAARRERRCGGGCHVAERVGRRPHPLPGRLRRAPAPAQGTRDRRRGHSGGAGDIVEARHVSR